MKNLIKRIGEFCFNNCSSITSITISKSINEIYPYTFNGCTNLKNICIPYKVTKIGSYAFNQCKNLEIINIPVSVREISDFAFCGCSSITKIKIISELNVVLGKSVFKGCSQLKDVKILSVSIINENTFCECTNLEQIQLPYYLKEIRDNAFEKSGLKKISIPPNVTLIGSYVFNQCEKLKSVKIEAPLTNIPEGLFFQCKILNEFTIPTVISIMKNAFVGISIKDITIPSSVKLLSSYSFANCKSLQKVFIHSLNFKVEPSVFDGCNNLLMIKFNPKATVDGGKNLIFN